MKATRVQRSVQQALQHARESSTGWWRTNCPECLGRTGKADHKACLAINITFGGFKCWKCGLKGYLPGYTRDLDTSRSNADPIGNVEPPQGFTLFSRSPIDPVESSVGLAPARDYMRKRCPEHLWWETQVGACLTGDYAGRVIVPVLTGDGSWVGWVGRTWFDSERAYTYPKGMNRGAALYNSAALAVKTKKPVLVVEGVFDALHLWPDAVALLGKASEQQMTALATTSRPVVMVLDGDAWMEGYSMASRLKLQGRKAGHVRLPPTLDPDEVPRDWLDDEVEKALA